jgi:hypothetical protein
MITPRPRMRSLAAACLREDSQVKRAIVALKTRGSGHDASIRQFTIDKTGFLIGEEFGPGTSFLAV